MTENKYDCSREETALLVQFMVTMNNHIACKLIQPMRWINGGESGSKSSYNQCLTFLEPGVCARFNSLIASKGSIQNVSVHTTYLG